jgi:glycosyltransferase involved in cell wall biosynthesis
MNTSPPVSDLPLVSVIIPARNEEMNLGACLRSLTEQSGLSFEIIVVDDGSTDRTRAIAESTPGIIVLSAPPLPPGWTGKNNALSAGVVRSRGQWLLFTDADTVHRPGSLARAVKEAISYDVALLSYSPEQVVGTFWERAVMPLIFAELASAYSPREICNPASSIAAANGQYLQISREAYEAVGGHAAVAGNLLEDVALARLVKQSGRKIFLRYGGEMVQTRMYHSFAQLREGWTKNLALLFPSARQLATLRFFEFLSIIASGAVAIWTGMQGFTMVAANATVMGLLLVGNFFARIARARFSLLSNLCSFFGLPLFSYLLLRSQRLHSSGGVSWKGRTYAPSIEQQASGAQSLAVNPAVNPAASPVPGAVSADVHP